MNTDKHEMTMGLFIKACINATCLFRKKVFDATTIPGKNRFVLFSSHFGTLVLDVLGDEVAKIYVIVYLFFISSCPSCLANGKHCTENHATKVTKKPKTKLPKYVMSQERCAE